MYKLISNCRIVGNYKVAVCLEAQPLDCQPQVLKAKQEYAVINGLTVVEIQPDQTV